MCRSSVLRACVSVVSVAGLSVYTTMTVSVVMMTLRETGRCKTAVGRLSPECLRAINLVTGGNNRNCHRAHCRSAGCEGLGRD